MVVCRVLISLHKNSFLVIGPLKIFKHLHNSPQCRTLCSDECSCGIFGHASTTVQLKIKEAIHMQWGQPTLNHQLYHVNLKLSL